MKYYDEQTNLQQFTAILRQVGINKRFDDIDFVRQNLTVEVMMRDSLGRMMLSLRSFVLANQGSDEMVEWNEYANWWEHFKAEVFPDWLKERFPVKARTQSAYTQQQVRVCPHLPIKVGKNEYYVHMNFLDKHHD